SSTRRPTGSAARGGHPHAAVRFLRGVQPLDPGHGNPLERQRRRGAGGVRGRRSGTRGHRRGPTAGHRKRGRGHAHGRMRLLRARRAGEADRRGADHHRRPVPGDHRRRLYRPRPTDRPGPSAAGARDRWPAPGHRRGPSGPRAATSRFHPCLRSTRDQLLHGAGGVRRTPMADTTPPDMDTFVRQAREWLATVARPRTERTWGEGSDSVAVFENWTAEQERVETDRIRAYEQAKFDAGWGALNWPAEYGGRGLPMAYVLAFRREEATFDVPRRTEMFSVTQQLVAPTI